MNDPRAWFFVPLLALFGVMWAGVSHLLAVLGGWSRLAGQYRDRGSFEGYRRRFSSGQLFGGVSQRIPCNYRSCLTLGSNSQGLFLAMLPLFRVAHPPLFIPWGDISATKERGFLFTYVSFAFTRVPPLRLRIGQGAARRIISEAGTYEVKVLEPAE